MDIERDHPLRLGQRTVQGGVVIDAQVAPQPDDGGGGHADGGRFRMDFRVGAVLPGRSPRRADAVRDAQRYRS